DQPVEACPPSRVYRLKKFYRRNKVVLTTTCIVATALVLATVFSSRAALRARRAEAAARRETEREAVVSAFLQDMVASLNPVEATANRRAPATFTAARDLLDQAARRLDSSP